MTTKKQQLLELAEKECTPIEQILRDKYSKEEILKQEKRYLLVMKLELVWEKLKEIRDELACLI